MNTPEMVCAKCGGERINVTFTATGYGKAEIAVDSKGKPYVDHVYDRDYDHEDHEEFSCSDCKATWLRLEEGLKPKQQAGITLHPGDRVYLPDGLKATVETVDAETNTFTVVGWHEVFRAGDGDPVLPMQQVAA